MKRAPYPLQWPSRLARTRPADRQRSNFGDRRRSATGNVLSPHATGREVVQELYRLGAPNWVITSNLPSRGVDGIPYADAPKGDDPGIAVWFEYSGMERVLACDRWFRPEENLRAIAKSIEAMRGMERWGVADVLANVFTGFAAALPAGPAPVRSWREVLGGDWPDLAPDDVIAIAKARHRRIMEVAHVDAGGSPERMLELNLALEAAERELAGVALETRR